jgi:hypothetical protein
MKFETKFDTGDIVQLKHERANPKGHTVHEVMEIYVQRCYTTTQVFYLTRAIVIVHDGSMYNPGTATAHTAHGWAKDGPGDMGMAKYREDELTVPDKKILDFLKKTPPVHTTILQAIENTLNPPKEKK